MRVKSDTGQMKMINRFAKASEIGDKDTMFRNLWRLSKDNKFDVFDYVPLTYSFRMKEKEFINDFQRFCQFFLSLERDCHIDQVEPIRVDKNLLTSEDQPIFIELDFKLPETAIQDRMFKMDRYKSLTPSIQVETCGSSSPVSRTEAWVSRYSRVLMI